MFTFIRTVSLYGLAWFGSVWGGILGGILGGTARAGFAHRESALPDPLIIRTVDQIVESQEFFF